MEVPFMRSYALALVQACHKRGAPDDRRGTGQGEGDRVRAGRGHGNLRPGGRDLRQDVADAGVSGVPDAAVVRGDGLVIRRYTTEKRRDIPAFLFFQLKIFIFDEASATQTRRSQEYGIVMQFRWKYAELFQALLHQSKTGSVHFLRP